MAENPAFDDVAAEDLPVLFVENVRGVDADFDALAEAIGRREVYEVVVRHVAAEGARRPEVAVDVAVFDRLRDGNWWRAPLASTLVGSTLDTALFFFIAFSAAAAGVLGTDHNSEFFNEVVQTPFGMELTRWIGTAGVDWCVKVAIALIALVPFRLIVRKIIADPA